jgi:hypothetical protein
MEKNVIKPSSSSSSSPYKKKIKKTQKRKNPLHKRYKGGDYGDSNNSVNYGELFKNNKNGNNYFYTQNPLEQAITNEREQKGKKKKIYLKLIFSKIQIQTKHSTEKIYNNKNNKKNNNKNNKMNNNNQNQNQDHHKAMMKK